MKDYKDMTVGYHKGMPSKEHWEINLKSSEGNNEDPHASFLPMPGKKRAQPHQKINECDH